MIFGLSTVSCDGRLPITTYDEVEIIHQALLNSKKE
jgi:hypothetical protein